MNSKQRLPCLAQILRHLQQVIRVMSASSTPKPVKLLLILGLLYCLSPWDLIPEWIPVLGVMDDLALALLLINWISRFAPPPDPPGPLPPPKPPQD